MDEQGQVQLFDDWAACYDHSVGSSGEYPFGGYKQVLDRVAELAAVESQMSVLDLGTGTGNLAQRFVTLDCQVWGTDFSAKMLDKARTKVPQARFFQADLMGQWPAALERRFERIVSAYVLHHFKLEIKLELLERLARQQLARGGRMVIADVAFPTVEIREQAHARWADVWDEDEYYWAADEIAAGMLAAGLTVQYQQVSSCGGVFTFETVE